MCLCYLCHKWYKWHNIIIRKSEIELICAILYPILFAYCSIIFQLWSRSQSSCQSATILLSSPLQLISRIFSFSRRFTGVFLRPPFLPASRYSTLPLFLMSHDRQLRKRYCEYVLQRLCTKYCPLLELEVAYQINAELVLLRQNLVTEFSDSYGVRHLPANDS